MILASSNESSRVRESRQDVGTDGFPRMVANGGGQQGSVLVGRGNAHVNKSEVEARLVRGIPVHGRRTMSRYEAVEENVHFCSTRVVEEEKEKITEVEQRGQPPGGLRLHRPSSSTAPPLSSFAQPRRTPQVVWQPQQQTLLRPTGSCTGPTSQSTSPTPRWNGNSTCSNQSTSVTSTAVQ